MRPEDHLRPLVKRAMSPAVASLGANAPTPNQQLATPGQAAAVFGLGAGTLGGALGAGAGGLAGLGRYAALSGRNSDDDPDNDVSLLNNLAGGAALGGVAGAAGLGLPAAALGGAQALRMREAFPDGIPAGMTTRQTANLLDD